MKNYFASLGGRSLPVLCWNFFDSPEEGAKILNSTTWEGWDSGWSAIATNGMGDAIVVSNGAVYEVQHGTGEPARLSNKIAEDSTQFAALLLKISELEECSESDSVAALRLKRDELLSIKKEVPIPLKQYFSDAISNVKEMIEDARWAQTTAGKLQSYIEVNYRTWEKDICEKWTVTNLMIRRHSSNKAVCVVGLADQASIELIIHHLSELSSYPVINLMKSL